MSIVRGQGKKPGLDTVRTRKQTTDPPQKNKQRGGSAIVGGFFKKTRPEYLKDRGTASKLGGTKGGLRGNVR